MNLSKNIYFKKKHIVSHVNKHIFGCIWTIKNIQKTSLFVIFIIIIIIIINIFDILIIIIIKKFKNYIINIEKEP